MRYLVEKLHEKSDKPWSEQPRAGTGPDSACFLYYASIANVIRFGLSQPHFKPGVYNISVWPEGSLPPKGCVAISYRKAA